MLKRVGIEMIAGKAGAIVKIEMKAAHGMGNAAFDGKCHAAQDAHFMPRAWSRLFHYLARREEDRPIGGRLRKMFGAQAAQHIVPLRRIIRHNHPCLELRPRAHLLR